VIQLSLVVSLTLAVVVLQEQLTPLRILGIALLALGPALMRNPELPEAKSDAAPPPALPKFVPRLGEGYAFALLAAAVYGLRSA
jgi:drug/metabolite transporter (DMT)-like permease